MDYIKPRENTKIYISCLPSQIEDEAVFNYFSQFGAVAYIDVKRDDTEDQRCTGFCQVTCSTVEMKDRIMSESHTLQGKILKITPYYEGDQLARYRELIKTHRIYVKNLPIDTSDQELRSIFLPYGRIDNAYCVKKKRYPNKKFGYVLFEDPKSINQIPEREIMFRGKPIAWYQTNKGKKKSSSPNYEKKPQQDRSNFQQQQQQLPQKDSQIIPQQHPKAQPQLQNNARQHHQHSNLQANEEQPLQDRPQRDFPQELIEERLRYFTPPDEALELNFSGFRQPIEALREKNLTMRQIARTKHDSVSTLMRVRQNHRVSNIRFNEVTKKTRRKKSKKLRRKKKTITGILNA